MNILFICRAFDNTAGGVEKMATKIMNEMANRGHRVTLLTWDEKQAQPFFFMDPRIQWKKLDMGRPKEKASWRLRLQRAAKIRSIVREASPDCMIAFQHGIFLSIKLYTTGLGIPTIAAEREAPSRLEHTKAGKHRHFIFQSMRLAKIITVQCKSYIQEYPSYLRRKIAVIPNPVYPAKRLASPKGRKGQTKTLLSVGRLGYQKNHTVLIKAFSLLTTEYPDWQLIIVGEGEDRQKLEKLIEQKSLQDRVQLFGTSNDIEELYCKSHLFALAARWEGFPNVVAESLSHGLPVVGFADCSGMKDLIEDGVTGLLAIGNDDAESFSESLRLLMKDENERQKMGERAPLSMKPYQPNKIFDQWELLFKRLAKP